MPRSLLALGAADTITFVRESPLNPKLLVLCGALSLKTLRRRGALQMINWRDLDGFFSHVWSVHPIVGASPEDAGEATGPLSCEPVGPRHTVVESKAGRFPFLARLPPLNFLIAQVQLIVFLIRLVRREGIGVVRAGDPYFLGLVGWVIARLGRASLVVVVSGNFDAIYASIGHLAYPRLLRFRRVEKLVARWVLSKADMVVALNHDNLRFAMNNGADPGRAAVLPLGNMLAPIHFSKPSSRASVVAELGLSDRPFLIYVGRLEVVKHPEDVLAVLCEARAAEPRLAAVLVGRGSLRSELEEAARAAGVEDALVFAGERAQTWIAGALAEASVVVSPLTGFALVEACLSGTPVVAYDVEWHSELIRDGETGRLVPYRDTHAMTEAVVKVLADRELADALGERARSSTLEAMDPKVVADRHRRSYAALLRGEVPSAGVV